MTEIRKRYKTDNLVKDYFGICQDKQVNPEKTKKAKSESKKKEYPTELTGLYKDDLDIIKIDEVICNYLDVPPEILENMKANYESKVKMFEEKVFSGIDYICEARSLAKEYIRIEKYENNKLLNEYKEETSDTIDTYKKVRQDIVPEIFGEKRKKSDEETLFSPKHICIEQYLRKASKYFPLYIAQDTRQESERCSFCGEVSGCEQSENGLEYCLSCLLENNVLTRLINNGETRKANLQSRESIEDQDKFYSELILYQGKGKVSQSILNIVRNDKELLEKTDEVKKMLPDKNTRDQKAVKRILFTEVKKKLSQNKKDLAANVCSYLLSFIYENIYSLENVILMDYENFSYFYMKREELVNRKMPPKWKLFFQLKHRGVECILCDLSLEGSEEDMELWLSEWNEILLMKNPNKNSKEKDDGSE